MMASEPAHPHTELIGVYRIETDWDSFRNLPFLIETYKEFNEPIALVELRFWGATFWSAVDKEPDLDSRGVGFDPFEIRQQHTKVEDTHYCDFAFYNAEGTSWNDKVDLGVLLPTEDARVLMHIRKFNERKPILTPFRVFDSYAMTGRPERLSGLSFGLMPEF